LGDVLAFLIQSPADFMLLGEMTQADKRNNPIHFRRYPADIRIRINPDSNLGSDFGLDGVCAL